MIASPFEELLLILFRTFGRSGYPGWCNVCERLTFFAVHDENIRETVSCRWCRSFNRKRQVMHVLKLVDSFNQYNLHYMKVWNMEASGSLHEKLERVFGDGYVGSAYLGKGWRSGKIVNGARHEDARATSFANGSLDLVVSCDVLEHVPRPERAFAEVSRILKPGGWFVFTVPYIEGMAETVFRVTLKPDGGIEHLEEPHYHGPVGARNILVCQDFGNDILDMCRGTGLECDKLKLYSIFRGMLGANGIVFVARKA